MVAIKLFAQIYRVQTFESVRRTDILLLDFIIDKLKFGSVFLDWLT